MHAAYQSGSDTDAEDAVFHVIPPPVPPKPDMIGSLNPAYSRYGAAGPNWPLIGTILMVHALILFTLVKLDVIEVRRQPRVPLVVELLTVPPPPPPATPEPETPKPVAPEIVAPIPVVQPVASPPPTVMVASAPPPAPPVAVASPPAMPTAPLSVGDLASTMIAGDPPRYPIESRRRKEQGTVVVALLLGQDGRVRDIRISRSSGHERLDRAVLDAARGFRWSPKMVGGIAVERRGIMSFPFAITGKA